MPFAVNTEKVIEKYQTYKKCCDGYELTLNNTRCRPVCEKPCIKGSCISPNVCKCEENYEGPFCNKSITCPYGKYGYDCTKTCLCKNDAACDRLNGNCTCQPGYVGKYCERPCSKGFYGDNCVNKCQCQNYARCNVENGLCYCHPGFIGKYCESSCPPSHYGYKCRNRCKCQNGATCDPINGSCNCQPGFVGKYCQIVYKSRTYGKNFEKNCNCNWHRAQSCDPLSGECICKYSHQGICQCEPGWTGYNCKTVCPFGTFGIGCNSTCQCHNEAKCRATDGVCLCKPGFFGRTCSEACPKNFYGEICLNKCMCNAREICDPVRGCICDTSHPDNKCSSELQLKTEHGSSNFLVKMILSFLIMASMCIGVLLCYSYYYQWQMKRSDKRKKNHKAFLQEHIYSETSPDAGNTTTSKYERHSKDAILPNAEKPDTYITESFYTGYKSKRNLIYESTENFYLEIGESSFTRPDDLYDHLDFLRPTGSWKPHYQSALVIQDQGSNSSNTIENKQ